jgi:hypothetical protein
MVTRICVKYYGNVFVLHFVSLLQAKRRPKEDLGWARERPMVGNGRSRVGQGGPRVCQGLTKGSLSVGQEWAK